MTTSSERAAQDAARSKLAESVLRKLEQNTKEREAAERTKMKLLQEGLDKEVPILHLAEAAAMQRTVIHRMISQGRLVDPKLRGK